MAETKIIETIQKEIRDFIVADEYFRGLDVINEVRGDIEVQVTKALSKLGLSIVVEIVGGKVQFQSVGVAGGIVLNLIITVEELVLINRDPNNVTATGKTAMEVVENLFRIFAPAKEKPAYVDTFKLVSDTGNRLGYTIEGTVQAAWTATT